MGSGEVLGTGDNALPWRLEDTVQVRLALLVHGIQLTPTLPLNLAAVGLQACAGQ
jgi:hypothetical protein